MSYFRDSPIKNPSNYCNFTINDLNQDVYFPFSSIQDKNKKLIHHSNKETVRNIWDRDHGFNESTSSQANTQSLNYANDFNFVPRNFISSNFSRVNLPENNTYSNPFEEPSKFTKHDKHSQSNVFKQNTINNNYKDCDINSIVDNYFNNKISLESRDSLWSSKHSLTQTDCSKQSRQSFLYENSYNSNNNQTKISTPSLNSSGNFSSCSNSDDNNHVHYENYFMNQRRNDLRDENKRPIKKVYSSLFMNEKDTKGEDYADLQELKASIPGTLWEYAKTQRGSR